MNNEILEILQIGFFDGIRWFPFVLAVGILFKYLKTIDVSVDGIAVISTICFTLLWNYTQSILLSFTGTAIISIVSYSLVSFFIYELKINNILAGIIFTLILHALSVIIIGESLPLKYEKLSFLDSSLVLLIITGSLAILTEFFFRTNLGIKIKTASDNYNINITTNPRLLILFIYAFAGIVLSVGAVVYTSKLGLSRSGGGFEFLITALSSFLFIDRIIDFLLKIINKPSNDYSYKHYLIFSFLQSPVFKALIGSILFQIIVLLIIFYTANSASWKLIFGIILLITVAKPQLQLYFNKKIKPISDSNSLLIKDISFEFDNGYEKRKIFENLNCEFQKGINLVWGNNGSGKTTLLKLLSGELKASSGHIYKYNKEVTNLSKSERRVFYITQNPYSSLSINSSVYENVLAVKDFSFFKNLQFTSLKKLGKTIDFSIFDEGFNSKNSYWIQKAGTLSGGQAQKLNLLLSSISPVNIILADEPTSGMDDKNFNIFLKFLTYIKIKSCIIIIVTHDKRLIEYPAFHYQINNNKLTNN
jgi:ABC-type multidrug transport system ATPase subunit/ABC-type uncharacterized transport system permease subunit